MAMRRRQFLTLLGSMAIGWPAEVLAQKSDRVRRIGALMAWAASDAVGLRRARVFTQALQDLGWTDGQIGLLDGQLPRLRATQNTGDVICRTTPDRSEV